MKRITVFTVLIFILLLPGLSFAGEQEVTHENATFVVN